MTRMILETQITRTLEVDQSREGGVRLTYCGPATAGMLGTLSPPIRIELNNQQANDLIKAMKAELNK